MTLKDLSKFILLTNIAFYSLFGCSTALNNKAHEENQLLAIREPITLPATFDHRAGLFETILAAKIAAGKHQYQTALKYYLAALDINPEIELVKEALVLSEKLSDHKNSLSIANIWVKLQPDAATPWQIIAFYSLSEQQFETAMIAIRKIIDMGSDINQQLFFFKRLSTGQNQTILVELFSTLEKSYPDNQAIPLTLAHIYKQQKKWNEALAITTRVMETQPELLIAWKYHASILITSDNTDDAISFYKQSLINFPDEDNLRYKLGQLFYDLDRFAEAREQFQHIFDHSPDDKRSQYMIAACYFSEENYQMSRQYFEPLLITRNHRNPALYYLAEMARKETDFNTAILFYRQIKNSRYFQTAHNLVARLMQQQGQYQQALDYLDNIKTHDTNAQINFKITKLKIMYLQKDIQTAEQYLDLVLQQHPDSMEIQLYRFQWLIEKGKALEIAELMPEVIRHFPKADDHKRLILTTATLLQGADVITMAIKMLDTQLTENEDSDYRYMRALFAAEINDIFLAEADLRYILSTDPDHTDALNALGYTLADANKNLQEARQLIEKAYTQNPDSPAIIDSMGWVLYRLGELSTALEYLQQAYKLDPSDEIASHLGEVLWVMDNKSAAKQILSSAIKIKPDSKVLQKILLKFNIELKQSTASQ